MQTQTKLAHPEFRELGSVMLDHEPGLVAQSYDYVAFVMPESNRVLIAHCISQPVKSLALYGISVRHAPITEISIIGNIVITCDRAQFTYTFNIPKFHVQDADEQQFSLLTVPHGFKTPKLLWSSDWLAKRGEESFLRMFDAILDEQSTGPWGEYTVSEKQAFQAKRSYSRLTPCLSAYRFGPQIPAAGRTPLLRGKSPGRISGGKPSSPNPNRLLVYCYRKGEHRRATAPREAQLPQSLLGRYPDQDHKMQQRMGSVPGRPIHSMTGRLVIATPYDQVTGTHEIRIVDHLASPSSHE
ncbi:hypothetical protein BKA70DRAFT_1259496 [Coprinopsis sp. MPI-PUGE-AT-0042]|nr:hypothetical protein BKA70DRAFT_1259496 [Coprinopsis sp. MPI-PUGE-AT-0042]